MHERIIPNNNKLNVEPVQRKQNQINRNNNVSIAHGIFVNGIYRDHGNPRPPKKK